MQPGDVLAWTSSPGLTIDGQTVPFVSPASTVSGSYKVWRNSAQSWTDTSTYIINDLGDPDPDPDPDGNYDGHLILWVKENVEGSTTTEKLINHLKAQGTSGNGTTELLYEFLKDKSNKLDHTERYWDVSTSSSGFPYTFDMTF